MSNYFDERDEANFAKIDSVLANLPEYVGYFITGISHRTSMLTRLNYASDIHLFLWYLAKRKFPKSSPSDITLDDLQSLNTYDIERYINFLSSYTYNGRKLSCNDKSKQRKLVSLRSLYKYLYKKDFINSNIMLKVDMPKLHDKPIVRLEVDEVVKLLDVAEYGECLSERQQKFNKHTYIRDVAILSMLLGTGIRVSELVGLNLQDLDFENDAFKVTRKGGNQSILYMPKETISALKQYLQWLDEEMRRKTSFGNKITDPDALFFSLQGTRITTRAVQLLVKKYSQSVSPLKKITPHKLRSTYATNLYRETGDIYMVADVLGHSDVNTTRKHYAEMNDENKRRAAKITVLRDPADTDSKILEQSDDKNK